MMNNKIAVDGKGVPLVEKYKTFLSQTAPKFSHIKYQKSQDAININLEDIKFIPMNDLLDIMEALTITEKSAKEIVELTREELVDDYNLIVPDENDLRAIYYSALVITLRGWSEIKPMTANG